MMFIAGIVFTLVVEAIIIAAIWYTINQKDLEIEE